MTHSLIKCIAMAAIVSFAAVTTAGAVVRVPHIQTVVFKGTDGNYSATITGTDFGAQPGGIPCTGCQPLQVQVVDIVSQPFQQVINVTSWSDTSITVTGIEVNKGDSVRVGVYNQTLGNVDTWGGPVIRQAKNTPIISSVTKSGEGVDLSLTITRLGLWTRS
ncbi:MAG: hypothetical protein WDM89_13510 [Rhizomicrobium sp.]